jgi:hypothetical protein
LALWSVEGTDEFIAWYEGLSDRDAALSMKLSIP